MALFANVFDQDAEVFIEEDHHGGTCLRIEDEHIRIDILGDKKLLCRIDAAISVYLGRSKDGVSHG